MLITLDIKNEKKNKMEKKSFNRVQVPLNINLKTLSLSLKIFTFKVYRHGKEVVFLNSVSAFPALFLF